MGTNDVLIDAFERIKEVVHDTVDRLDEEQLTFRPGEEANSIAWLIWHLTRVQDDHMSELAGHKQAWTTDGWYDKFGLPFDKSATGYGQTSEEVGRVRTSSDLLVDYYDAVHKQTDAYLKSLNEKSYEGVIDISYNPPVTVAVRIVSVITDDLQHCGQAAYVKGLITNNT